MSCGDIRLKRAYDDPADNDGMRVLVDGMWPRGVAKADARIDEWLKTLAPSKSLRQWFNHDADKFDEFRACFKQELTHGEAAEALERLRAYYRDGHRVTLVYAARDREHNNAVVLKEILQQAE